jgi:hypothetical protein
MKITKNRLKQIIKEEIENVIDEGDGKRKAGISTPHQILKLNPDFKFQKKPTSGSQRLKVLQDVDNPNTATVLDLDGDVMGTLDLKSDSYWLRSVVTFAPGLVDRTLDQYRK